MTFIEFKDLSGELVSIILEKICMIEECDIDGIKKGSKIYLSGASFYTKESRTEVLEKIQRISHNKQFNDKFDEKVLNDKT